MPRFFTALLLILSFLASPAGAQTDTGQKDSRLRPFEGHFFCKETGLHIFLNLYEENIEVPGFGFLGKMHGYMEGGIYGTWMLIRHQIDDKEPKALLRFSNDIGSDSQNIEFVQTSDSTYTYQAVDGNVIKKAVGRKLVKVTDQMNFVRK